MGAVMWLSGTLNDPEDPGDMIATIEAEDAFDASADLYRIVAPTLVICGARDGFYGADLATATAVAIPDAQLVIVPGKSHISSLSDAGAQRIVLRFLLETHG